MLSTLDAYDRRILTLLQEDSSLSSAEIAEQVGLSQSPCWRRIQRLKEEGVIRRQVILLDRKKIGLNTQIFAEVKLNAHGRSNLTEFAEAMREFPEVLECYVLMGSVDFLLRIVTQDIEAYE
ncbi:MAG: Lrp/AsnC family transcriptional regulator, partial [Pseudomonas sp.]|nr:Lrp/AsnC family transcriptional regulator [Pseudomonas sp.]